MSEKRRMYFPVEMHQEFLLSSASQKKCLRKLQRIINSNPEEFWGFRGDFFFFFLLYFWVIFWHVEICTQSLVFHHKISSSSRNLSVFWTDKTGSESFQLVFTRCAVCVLHAAQTFCVLTHFKKPTNAHKTFNHPDKQLQEQWSQQPQTGASAVQETDKHLTGRSRKTRPAVALSEERGESRHRAGRSPKAPIRPIFQLSTFYHYSFHHLTWLLVAW